jgi:hypothetical protein
VNAIADLSTDPQQQQDPSSFFHTHLAPPFSTPWSVFRSPVPRGFWGSIQMDSGSGEVVMRFGANPHSAGAPLTIGWLWCGWKRRMHVQLATFFRSEVLCHRVTASGGGVWVPRTSITLTRVDNGQVYDHRERLFGGAQTAVGVVVPQSNNLPAFIAYDLVVGFNVRVAFKGAETPTGELRARIDDVWSRLAIPLSPEGAESSAGEQVAALRGGARSEPADGDLDPQELLRELARLEREMVSYDTGSDREALAAGLVAFDE